MKFNIRLKLILFTSCIVLLVGGSISLYSIYVGKHRILGTFENDGQGITTLIAGAIVNDLYFLDLRSLRHHLEIARVNPDISYTYAMDLNGVVLADGTSTNALRDRRLTDPFSEEVLLSDRWISRIEGVLLKIGGPIVMPDGSRIGHLQVGFSLHHANQLVSETTRASLYLTVFCLGIGVVLAFMVATSFSRPILSIMQASKKIGEGRLDTRLPVNRRDELGTLAESVNQMAETLETRHNEIKRAEETLQESQEHLRLLLETTNAIPWEASAETWQFTYVGPQAARILGYPVNEWYQKDFWTSHIHPDDREYAIDFCLKSSSRSKDYEFEYRMIRSDGSIAWFHDLVSVESVNGVPKMLRGFMIDITERKQAEQAVRESQEDLRLMADSLPVLIAYVDAEQRYQFTNTAYEKWFGLSHDMVKGRRIKEVLGERAYESVRRYIEVALSGQQVSYEAEVPFENRTPRHIQADYVPRIGENGAVSGFYVLMRDITERKLSEEVLRKSHGEIRQLAGRLISAQEDERRRLARELHDDLTQRLAVLAIDAGILGQHSDPSPGLIRAKLPGMKEQIVRLSADIHRISRQLHPSILDDLGLVDAIKSFCTGFSNREGISVEFTPENLPEVLPKDLSLCLYRITQESLRNVAKHARAKEAHVSLAGNDGSVLLSIQDSGVGFDLAQVRGKPGLGLASMEERVRLIQGSLSVQSQPAQGTTIEVRAPLARGDG